MKLKSGPGGKPMAITASGYAPLLLTERLEEFESVVDWLDLEVRGRNTIERFYIEQAIRLMWMIRRHQRSIEAIQNEAMRPALENVLTRHQKNRSTNYAPKDLARDWITDEQAKRTVSEILKEVGLDESTIELEAWRMVAPEHALLNQMLASLMSQLKGTLRMIAQYGHVFSRKGMANLEVIHEEAHVRRRLARR